MTTDGAALERTRRLLLLDRELEEISIRIPDSRLVRYALRAIAETLGADLALQADLSRHGQKVEGGFELPLTASGRALLASEPGSPMTGRGKGSYVGIFGEVSQRIVAGRAIGDVPRSLLVAPVGTDERRLAVLGFVRRSRGFSRGELRWLLEAAERISKHLVDRRRERARRLRERISTKIFSELRPKDVLYQILHGLKKLFHYDHSGAVLLLSPDGRSWTVQAEIVTWTKGKSERVGLVRKIDPATRSWLMESRAPLLLRRGHVPPGHPTFPVDLHGPLLPPGDDEPPVGSCLLAVLRRKDQVLGALQLLSRQTDGFTREDESTLAKFLPLASATVYNSELYAIQYDRMISAERQVGLAELARAISHDLNNAFGVILPLLQTMRRDLETGPVTAERLRRDLGVALHYASYSARIFEGLLSMGRGRSEPFAWLNPNTLVESVFEMIGPNLAAHQITVRSELGEVPRICARRGEMEQLLLNLIYNARDAMADGGTLTVRTRSEEDGGLSLEVGDTGVGIDPAIREKIFEPFFTTKKTGTGLGLDICRSIAWEYGGRISLDGNPGGGTVARVWLPPWTERVPAELRAAASVPPVPRASESRADPTVGFRTTSGSPTAGSRAPNGSPNRGAPAPERPTNDPDRPTNDPDRPTSDPGHPTSDPDRPTNDPGTERERDSR